METIAAKLEHGRQTLLDLSTRNRLLSIPQRASGKLVHIHDEKAAHVHDALVRQEKSFTFLPGRKAEGPAGEGVEGDDEAGILLPQPEEEGEEGAPARHRDLKLQTKLASDTLQHRLLEMFHDARTFIEEQGVNILYLALGQLRWFEPKAPEKERFAPLVLVPVALTRKSAAERFHLAWLQGEEVAENLSLAAKLKADFGLVLPEFKGGDDFDPQAYIQAVADAVASQQGWAVLPDAITLGFFSFAKFLMYRDLDAATWPEQQRVDQQPLIRAVLEAGFPAQDDPFDDDVHIDRVLPAQDQRHVVDSDSSQTLAVETVRRGTNLVIQGPPGTGKSQTITNVIAAALADGKKVLFVSEKMAALEVVQRRLTAIGLGPACLELHSHKSNKRAVLEELKKTRDLGKPRVAERDQVVQHLQALREKLNQHAECMHTRLEPFQLHAYDVLGQLARLARHGDAARAEYAPNAATWTPADLRQRGDALADLRTKGAGSGAPAQHAWRGVGHPAVLKLDADQWLVQAREALRLLDAVIASAAALGAALGRPAAADGAALQRECAVAAKLAAAPALDRAAIVDNAWSASSQQIADVAAAGKAYAEALPALKASFLDSAWEIDAAAVRRVVAERGESLFRIFSGEYRDAVRILKGQLRGPLPGGHQERLKLLDGLAASIAQRRQVREAQAPMQAAFGTKWQGEASDWIALAAIVDWVRGGAPASFEVRQLLAQVGDPGACGKAGSDAHAQWSAFAAQFGKVQQLYALDLQEAFGAAGVEAVALASLSERLQAWQQQPVGLFAWVQYFAARVHCRTLGLGALVSDFEGGRVALDDLEPVFLRSAHEAMLRALCARFPQLVAFDGEQHQRAVADFRAVDLKRIDVARAETALQHFQGIPRTEAGIGPMGVLNGEIARKRGHMPLRRLFKQAAPAIQAIKPVFMMSPLSVAQFLEPGSIAFDLLVVDEASQIEPIDALGAIARCKQMVVVGDDRQLPPTRFFARMTSDVEAPEDEEMASAQDVESILGLCVSRGMPQKMLRWHYRSRHQSLIAVSNQQFYESRLFIVPSPTSAAGAMGLRFHHVKNGVFDTGGTRVNREEAKVIARAIMEHAMATPQLSLGVASFSLQQRTAIQDELELLRRAHPECEPFFAAHPEEPFFIKNLENVQGDERDVIFISVAYARGPNGQLAMRFGPVGADGGERRLNVLISRAKQRCEVFSSITADDIDLERTRGKGVAALKVFLMFAETGELALESARAEQGAAALEQDVREALEAQGLVVHSRVGIAGFFVDLAIVDMEQAGRYVLGIELDGESYRAARSARDRDRLRQAVLQDHGWMLHRLWANDWFRQPEVERQKILDALAAAKAQLAERDQQRAAAASPASLQFDVVEREGAPPAGNGAAGKPRLPYVEANFDVPRHKELHELPPHRLAGFTHKVVQEEGPVHVDEVVTRLRGLWGLQRAGSRIRDAVEASIELLVRDRTVVRDGPFLDLPDRPPRVRSRASVLSTALRKPEYLAPAEIQQAIRDVLAENLGGRRDELSPAVAKALGLSVVTAQVREAVEREVDRLHQQAAIALKGNVYTLPS